MRLDPALEPYQVDALAEFVSGPRKLDQAARQRSPYANLIRRGLLDKVGEHGASTYALTEAGRAAITSRGGASVSDEARQAPSAANAHDSTRSA